MTIQEAFETLKAADPRIESVSESQSFPPFEDGSAFVYWVYTADGAFQSREGWEDLIEKVSSGVANSYL